MELRRILPALCKKKGLTLSKLSKLSGVPISTLDGWSSGRKVHDLDQLRAVAAALEVSLFDLAFGESDPFAVAAEEVLSEIFSGDVRVTLHRIQKKVKR